MPPRSRTFAPTAVPVLAVFCGLCLPLSNSARVAGATIVVDTLADNDLADGLCSLREALLAADSDTPRNGCPAGAGGDVVEFGLSGTILVGSNLPVVHHDLTLVGPPTGTLTVNGDGHRLLVFNGEPNGGTLHLVRMVLRNGANTEGGGCITIREADHLIVEDSRIAQCTSDKGGGAIYGDFAASISLLRTTLQGNSAEEGGGGLYLLGEGYDPLPLQGPQQPTATLSLIDSTLNGNETSPPFGGGGFALAFANGEIRRSTLSGNTCGDAGGAALLVMGTLEIDSSTLTLNLADSDDSSTLEGGGGLYALGSADLPATVLVHSTVVADNESGSDASDFALGTDAALISGGANLVGVREGAAAALPLGQPNLLGDWVGSRAAALDAGLAALADNGGSTRTHSPSASSLLIDHGDCPGELRDQRSYGNPATSMRPMDNPAVADSSDGCDIGAVETDGVELGVPGFRDGFESGNTGTWSIAVL